MWSKFPLFPELRRDHFVQIEVYVKHLLSLRKPGVAMSSENPRLSGSGVQPSGHCFTIVSQLTTGGARSVLRNFSGRS